MLALLFVLACNPTVDETGDGDSLHGQLTEADGMRVLQLWGTREEMGYAEGALLCDEIVDNFQTYILEHLVAEYDVPYELLLLMAENSITLPEGDARELEAMYQGAVDHCTTEQLTVTSEYLEPTAGGEREITYLDLVGVNSLADFACSSFSTWGESTASGDTLYGRNFDWAVDPGGSFLDGHLLKVYDSEEEGRFVSLFTGGVAGCVSCFTEEGVGVTMNNVYEPLKPSEVTGNTPRMLAARKALTDTIGATDVVGVFEAALEAEPLRSASNLHLAFPRARHADYGAVVVEVDGNTEHADGEATVREPGWDAEVPLNALVATNHYVQRAAPMTDEDSRGRYDKLVQGLADQPDPMDLDDAHALMASVAMWATVHTVLYDAASQELWVYVSEEAGQPATDYEPARVHLPSLFEDLP